MEIQSKPLETQKQMLEDTLEAWMNHPKQPDPPAEQVDDILIIGVKVWEQIGGFPTNAYY